MKKSNKYGKWCAMCLVSFVAVLLRTGDVYAADGIIPNDETGIPDKAFYQLLVNACDEDEDGMLSREEAEKREYIYIYGEEAEAIQSIQGI